MNILAIDSTTPVLFLAYGSGDDVVLRRHPLGRRHSTHLLPAVVELLQGRARPDAVAVAAGPGSYTGIRIGMATAEGLKRGFDVPALAIPTFLGWAEPYHEGRVVTAIDARGGRVFAQVFQDGEVVRPADLYPAEAIAADLANGCLVALPDCPLEAARRVEPSARGLLAVAERYLRAGRVPPFVPHYVRPAAVDQRR